MTKSCNVTCHQVLNSTLNFVVYCLFHRQFRANLHRQLCCLFLRTASSSGNSPRETSLNYCRRDATEQVTGQQPASVAGRMIASVSSRTWHQGNSACVTLLSAHSGSLGRNNARAMDTVTAIPLIALNDDGGTASAL